MALAVNWTAVPKLAENGSNLFQWETAFKLYAQANGFTRILDGSISRPKVDRSKLLDEPTAVNEDYPTESMLKVAQDCVRQHNKAVAIAFEREDQDYRWYMTGDAALKLALLHSVDQEYYAGLSRMEDVRDQLADILNRYRENYLEYTSLVKTRAEDFPTAAAFVDKFRAGLAKVNNIKSLRLDRDTEILLFLAAIKSAYPDYQSKCCDEINQGVELSIDSMCNGLILHCDQNNATGPNLTKTTKTRHSLGGACEALTSHTVGCSGSLSGGMSNSYRHRAIKV